ncbi:hypothetical protein SD421_10085 [Qipengyuania sp. HL-TH1]|uniref:hypothetical protein n=1 Tax=Qipengyuania profunda TaxID=3113984 RepID=UPI002A187F19|nr:hypothetical protein [Qipengyuania sp. HL-TH1]WPL55822.1 hypothetical protein SD421_10085 [Qipengyuania sp. HL-TH5]
MRAPPAQHAVGIVVERLGQQHHKRGTRDPARRDAPVERTIRQRGRRHPPFAKFFERVGQFGPIDARGRSVGLRECALERGLAYDRRRGGRRGSRYGIVALGFGQPAAGLIGEIGIDAGLAPPVERTFEARERCKIARVRRVGVHHSSKRRS